MGSKKTTICYECKWYDTYYNDDICTSPKNINYITGEKGTEWKSPEELNQNGNCKLYKAIKKK